MKKLLSTLALVGLTTTAFAQQADNFYVGAELGYTKVSDSTKATATSLVSAVGGAATVTQNTGLGIGRLFGGYKFNENFAAEVGYNQTGDVTQNIAGVAGNSVAYTGSTKVSVSGVDYSLIARPSISSGLNGFFVRAGGHYMTEKADITLTGTSTASISKSLSGSGLLFGVGYDTSITKNIDFRASYTYLNKIGGTSDYANVFSVGVLTKF